MDSDRELVGLVIGLARMGFRGTIKEQTLSCLVGWAKDYGVAEVLSWIDQDPGWLIAPSWRLPLAWQIASAAAAECQRATPRP
jgi:hypothetical protein